MLAECDGGFTGEPMIYFLVNNGYQYVDALSHLDKVGERSLIVVPHTIGNIDQNKFSTVYMYRSPFQQGAWRDLRAIRKLKTEISRGLNLTREDVLFFYTEYEPINQLIVALFKRSGARVYMIEDGGVASYLLNMQTKSDFIGAKTFIKQLWIRAVLGTPSLQMFRVGNEIFPRAKDDQIDGLIYYRPVQVARNIPRHLVTRSVVPISVRSERVLFLNQPLYDGYQSESEYLHHLSVIIRHLKKNFPEVYFKFHPREGSRWRNRILQHLACDVQGVDVLDDDSPIEAVVDAYTPKFVASFFSSGLMSLLERGVEPIFLYRLTGLSANPVLAALDSVLTDLSYNHPQSWEDVNQHFESRLLSQYSTKTVRDVILSHTVRHFE